MVPFAGIIWHLTYGECHYFRSSLKVLELSTFSPIVHRSIVRSTHWTICNLLNTRSSALHANYGIVHLDLFELLTRILFWQWQSSPLKYVHILYMSHILQFSRFFSVFWICSHGIMSSKRVCAQYILLVDAKKSCFTITFFHGS